MKKRWKQIMSILLAGSLLFGDSALGFALESRAEQGLTGQIASALAAEDVSETEEASETEEETETAAEEVDSGTCGDTAHWTYYSDGVLVIDGVGAMTEYSYSGYVSERPWQPYAEEITEVIIGDEITSIGRYAFRNIESIENIVLGANVAAIGRYAFADTTPKYITLPNVDFTDNYAFPPHSYSGEMHEYCITVRLRADASVLNYTFLTHPDVEAYEIVEAYDETAPVCFAASEGVLYTADFGRLVSYPKRRQQAEYTVCEGTKVIEPMAFWGSFYVEKVNLPEGLECIGSEAFYDCNSLREINIPETVTTIESYAFAGTGLQEIVIPDSVTTMENAVFKDCTSLEKVIIGDGVTEIPELAFNHCGYIKELKLGRNVTNILQGAFTPVSNAGSAPVSLLSETEEETPVLGDEDYVMVIEELQIPVNEVSLGEYAFDAVDARRVSLYSDTASGSDSVFLSFPGTESFEILGLSREDAEARYAQRDGVLFDTEYKELVSYPRGRSDAEYRIAEGMSTIHTKAFYNADNLERLYIAKSVNSIGEDAFAECDLLTIYCDANSYAAQYAEENEIPYSTLSNNIEFTLQKRYSTAADEELLVCKESISNYEITVKKEGVVLYGCRIYRGNILLPADEVEAGEVLEISLISKTGETLDYTSEVTLDENGYAGTEFEVVQKGRFKAAISGAQTASVLVFDMDGNRLAGDTCTAESYVSGFYDSGSYQVLVIYGEDSNWPFETLEQFKNNHYIGERYTLKTVEITDNVVTDLEEITVEEISVTSAIYLEDPSCYYANTEIVSQNGLIQMKAEYQFQETEETVTPKALRISIPENCSYVDESMKMNGEYTDLVTVTEKELVISLEQLHGEFIFNLKPVDFGTISSRAVLEFETEQGELSAVLGTVEVLAPYISLDTGSKTCEEIIVVSGVTLPETEVRIYDGAYRIGTVKSSKSGRWSASVALVNAEFGSVHDIQAVIYEGTEEEKLSNTVEVFFEEWSVEVLEFKMDYPVSSWYYLPCDLRSGSKGYVSFYPTKPIIFTIKLSEDEKVDKVYVVNTKNGKEELIEAEYNSAKSRWIAQKVFNYNVPGELSVRVIEKPAELQVNKNTEFIIDPSSVSEELKNAEYEELLNNYDEETGLGEYEGNITLADEENTEIGIKITGEELQTDTVTENELLNEGYRKTQSTDGSATYYSKVEIYENGDVELQTIEAEYDYVNVAENMRKTSILFSTGKLVEAAGTAKFGQVVGGILGDAFGTGADSIGYMKDLYDEEGIYQRIKTAREELTKSYTEGRISRQEYSKKLDQLIEISDTLVAYQLLKAGVFVIGGIAGMFFPILGLGISLASCCFYEYIDSNFEIMFADFYSSSVKFLIDPSGYVYEGAAQNRLEDVNASIYYREEDESGTVSAVLWDAEEYEQINPQHTKIDGAYAWDVPEGYWKVVFEKEGYETAETEWLPVPPIQTDVNIGMVSKEPAAVQAVTLYEEYAILLFDKYVQAESLTSETVKIYSSDYEECEFTVEAVNGTEQGAQLLATEYRLRFTEKLSASSCSVAVSESIQDYAGRNLKEGYTCTEKVKPAITEIRTELPKQIVMGVETAILVSVVTEGDLADYDIEFISPSENVVEILSVSEVDKNGSFEVSVEPNLPVSAIIEVYADGLLVKEIPLEIQVNEMPEPEPTPTPTAEPTEEPAPTPTAEPTEEPSPTPTAEPTEEPTPAPTAEPTEEPTPTAEPTEEPKRPVTEIFDDVYNDWYTQYVQYVYDHNLMTGMKGTRNFAPNANITKAQVAQVLYNMEEQPVVDDHSVFGILKDVYSAEWYANAVAWAYNHGIVTGDLNTKRFNPNADVTREQLALMMYRYAKYKGYNTEHATDFAGLVGENEIANWSKDGVTWAVGAGLISGIEKNGIKYLEPQGNASRAQVAAILQRFCKAYENGY